MPKNTEHSQWLRLCPNCNQTLYYSCSANFYRAKTNKTLCRSCRMTNKRHSDLTKEKISKNQIGRIPWNKDKTGVYSQETLRKIGESSKGRPSPKKDKPLSESTKKKLRLKRIEQLNTRHGQISPNYNPIACQLFEDINREMNWNGQHAENGGEFFIKELGYWVDYYEPNLNIVIEFDENKHKYTVDKDMKRQKEIEDHLGCKFYRIPENRLDSWKNILL